MAELFGLPDLNFVESVLHDGSSGCKSGHALSY